MNKYELCRYCSCRPCRCESGRAMKIHQEVKDLDGRYGGLRDDYFGGFRDEDCPSLDERLRAQEAGRTLKDPRRVMGHTKGGGGA